MQSAKKPAKLEELTLLKVRLWLVLEYFRNGNFGTRRWGGGIFQFVNGNSRWPWPQSLLSRVFFV